MKRAASLFFKISIVLSLFLILVNCARSEIICRVETSTKMVAFTFDDGPSEITLEILDILAQYGTHATFFVTGENANRFPLILKAVFDAGHTIGNHTFDHPRLTEIGESTVFREIRNAQNAVFKITQQWPVFFRPPYSAIQGRIETIAESFGLKIVLGSLSSGDYTGLSADEISNLVLTKIRPGAIVIFHDHKGRKNTVDALRIIMVELAGQGYRFVTLPELIRNGKCIYR